VLAVLVLAGCSAAGPREDEVSLWAGVATVDLSPSRDVPLGGYGARKGKPMTGIHDPVYGKVLWLKTRDGEFGIVTTDLIGSTLEIRDAIRPEGTRLVLAASHNHSGPGALARGIWVFAMGGFDAALLAEITGKLKTAVERARSNLLPARIAFARTAVPELCRNRRHKDGPVDPDLSVMIVSDAVSRPIAVLAHYTAHGTVLSDRNFQLSADWPGAFQRALERRVGAPVLYLNGAEGDIAPRPPSGRDDFEQAEAMGEALAARAASLLEPIANPESQVRISYVERGVDLPSPTLPLAPNRSVLGLLEINGTRMYCIPGEPCVELGLDLKRRSPGAWVVGLANDHLGYFLTEEEYAKGGYERSVSFYGPKMGPWLVERLAELGEREHAPDRPGQPEGGRR
jgi:hypothetical protein